MTSCRICGSQDEAEHRALEDSGLLRHQWSIDGALLAVEKKPKPPVKKTPQRPQIVVMGSADLVLRQMLVEKGILTDEDFTTLLNSGTGPSGDREDRETPSSG